MHARLIENDMRHVRQALFHISHPPAAYDAGFIRSLGIARLPESGFIDPIGLFQNALSEAKGFKHFHRTAGNTVSLPQLQRTGLLLHDHRANIWKRRQLRGQRQPRRATANNQNIGLRRPGCPWYLRRHRCI